MKKIYRLLVILMGLMVFITAYVLIKKDQFSNIQPPEQSTSTKQQKE